MEESYSKKMEENVFYTDFMCPICLQLLIKPVVLPCKHELCMPCFQAHVEVTSLCCPMCRVRISNWARRKGREGKLVDEERWALIQKLFPERCERRLRGEDDDDDSLIHGHKTFPIVAKDGDLRKEYEQELLKVELEKEEELKASEEVVQKLREEARQFEEALKEDEKIAKQLQKKELEKIGGNISSLNTKLVEFLEVCKLPNEMTLRSSTTDKKKSLDKQSTKSKACLTKWLSKAGSGSENPGPSRQEKEDYNLAVKLQKELDAESRKRLSPITLNQHFYPLRHKGILGSASASSKRLKIDEVCGKSN